jgi:hypothetical protein
VKDKILSMTGHCGSVCNPITWKAEFETSLGYSESMAKKSLFVFYFKKRIDGSCL